MTVEHPKQIGKYQLVGVLGEGAMGIVYRAFDQVLNRYLAIKVMNASIGNNAQLRERFLREARAAGSLQHPNVVTIYDFGEAGEHLFIAMEFVDGEDLSSVIRRKPDIAISAKLDVMIDVLNGLAYAHNRGVVHRDIKPANIRVTTDTRAKLLDFGIAYLQQSELTQSGVLMGTPQYMAPEQVSGGAITAATDVFAAASVLYEFLTYTRPFEGDTLHVILYNIMSTEPPSLSEMIPKAPTVLHDVLSKAMSKDPAQRYPSAVEMSQALSAARQAISPSLDAATITVRTSHTPGLPPPPTALRTSQIQGMIAAEVSKRQRRNTWQLTGLAAALLLAVVYFQPWASDNGAGPDTAAQSTATNTPSGAPPNPPVAQDPPAIASETDPPGTVLPISGSTAPTGRGDQATGQQATDGRASSAATQPPPVAGGSAQAESMIQSMRTTALGSRRAASEQGATAADLARGDSVLRIADGLVRQGRAMDAGPELTAAATLWNDGARVARNRAAAAAAAERQQSQPPPVATAPPPTVPETTARPPVQIDHRAEIESIVAAYRSAIESESVAAIRRVYPGLTAEQQQGWERFFGIAENVRATYTIGEVVITGETATVAINAEHAYQNNRRAETNRFPLSISLTRDGSSWRIVRIR